MKSRYPATSAWFKVLWILTTEETVDDDTIIRKENTLIVNAKKPYQIRLNPVKTEKMYNLLKNVEPRDFSEFKDVKYQEKYWFNDIRKIAFRHLADDSFATKILSSCRGFVTRFKEYGGVYFVIIEDDPEDNRRRTLHIDDSLLMQWFNNLFHYYLRTNLPWEYLRYYEEIDIFSFVELTPRQMLRTILYNWTDYHIPTKDEFAKRIFDVVALERIYSTQKIPYQPPAEPEYLTQSPEKSKISKKDVMYAKTRGKNRVKR